MQGNWKTKLHRKGEKDDFKENQKVISLVLVLSLTMLLWPQSVYAEISQAISENTTIGADNITDENEYLALNNTVFELTDRREKAVKHFHLTDGTVAAVQYDIPVHYIDENGEWQDIDNTLTASGSEYTTSNARVKFAKKITGSETLFTLHDGNHKITMSLVDAKKKVAGQVTNTKTEFGDDATELQKLMTLDKLSARIVYTDILDGVDLEYVVNSVNIKENIIVKEKRSSYSYDFTVKLNNLDIAFNNDGSIRIFDPQNDEVVYTIPRGYMYDANGELSYAVDYAVNKNKNGSYTFTVSADEAWINAENRTYPVTIDPPIGVAASSVTDLYISNYLKDDCFNSLTEIVVGAENGADNIGYWKTDNLPSLPESAYLVNASLYLVKTYGSGAYVGAYKVTSAWNGTLTWNEANTAPKQGEVNSHLLDHNYITSDNNVYSWNLTEMMREIYTLNQTFYGVAFKIVPGSNSVPITFCSNENSNLAYRPQFIIQYVDLKGIESYWSYSSQDIGLAGTSYVNYANGKQTLIKSTISTTDSLMPYSPMLIYNSWLAGKEYKYTTNSVNTAHSSSYMPYGFKLSIDETVIKKSFTGIDGSSVYYYILADSDGTEHYFLPTQDSNIFLDEDGLQLELKIDGSNVIITDSDNNIRTYTTVATPSTEIAQAWKLTSISDKIGNKITFVFDTSSRPTAVNLVPKGLSAISMLTILYNDNGKPYVIWNHTTKEAVVFRYSSTYNGAISTTGNYLRQVVHAHGSDNVSVKNWLNFYNSASNTTNITVDGIAYYEYDSDGYLISAKDGMSKYEVRYPNSFGSINDIQEYANGNEGQKIRISYGSQEIRTSGKDDVFGNDDDIITRFNFDARGRIIATYSMDGIYTQIYGLSNQSFVSDNSYAINSLKISATMSGESANYLLNGGSQYWLSYGNITFPTSNSIYDNNQIAFNLSSNATDYIFQFVSLKAGTYTLSCNVFSYNLDEDDVELWLIAESLTDSSRIFSHRIALNSGNTSDQTSFDSLTFKVDLGEDYTEVNELFKISIKAICNSGADSSQKLLVSDIMLAKRNGVQNLNIVNNGDFEQTSVTSSGGARITTASLWTSKINDTASGNISTYSMARPHGRGVKIDGNIAQVKTVEQVLFSKSSGYTCSDDEIFTVSAFGYIFTGPNSSSGEFAVELVYDYLKGTTTKSDKVICSFNNNVDGWQLTSGTLVIPSGTKVTKLTVKCVYANNVGSVLFDDICVTRSPGENVTKYEYDDKGRISGIRCGDKSIIYTYNGNGDIESVGTNSTYTCYTYFDASEGNIHTVKKETTHTYKLKLPSLNPIDTILDFIRNLNPLYRIEYTYNNYGQITCIKTTDNTNSNTNVVQVQNTYNTSSGSKIFGSLATEIDSLGKTTRYFYDSKYGRLAAVIYPDNTGICYTYDAIGRLTLVQPATYSTTWSAVTNSAKVSYTYNSLNQLSTIQTNGTTYTFTYDDFGNTSTIKIGSTTISSVTRNANNGKVNKITYGNGITASYTYDELDRVAGIVYNNGSTKQAEYKYEYNANGYLSKFTDTVNNRETTYMYGKDGRLTGSVESSTSDSNSIISSVWYRYDTHSRLVQASYDFYPNDSLNILSYNTTYNELSQISNYSVKLGNTKIYDVVPTYDYLSRTTGKTVTLSVGSSSVSNTITYEYLNNSDKTSDLVYQYIYTINGTTVTNKFTYDSANQNIIEIRNASNVITNKYTYDTLGRLIREDNKAADRTYIYTYNADGGILTKKTYGFTIASGTPTTELYSTYNYQYSDYTWRDKLTSYRGTTLTYDAIGNPLSYYNGNSMTFTWESGRNLAGVVKGSVTTTYKYSDGLRISKTVGGVTHNYIYDGDLILCEYYNGTTLIFIYDENGAPIGFKHNSNYYLYEKNLMGDIVGIYDKSGTKVASYVYDAWGNMISETGTMANVNPFRYRSYYYDTETGFYWLYTRYYDPAIGRFINADDISYLGANGDLNSYNLYAYCSNNPVMGYDPHGNFAISAIIIGVLIGAVIGFGGTVLADYADDGEVFNGSISTGGYIANSLTSALIGGLTGGIGSSTFSFTYPILNLATTGAGTTAVMMGTATTTITGAELITGGILFGGLIMFARIGKSGGYRIDHHYPNDHDPLHVHINGDDGTTRVDLNGNPIQGDRPMTPGERKAFGKLFEEIIRNLKPWMQR